MAAAEVRFDGEVAPVVEFLHQRRAGSRGLQAQRVAAQVGLLAAIVVARDQELGAEGRQRVGSVAGQAFGFERIHGRDTA